MDNAREKELLYKLLYQVLIEIREEAHLKENKKIFYLSDLVHNVPLQLRNAKNESDYERILKKIEERAENRNMEKWLKNALSQL
ncbi:hypothetical protein [Chryseolinea soli]|uniref:Uncharacterized protein n=1 Tax=Chryseolinea soli TaxID=2321403 RepID=A0A385SGB0_9BACT|nr:hypothetical protein [Chryseolinea soli]AYB29337.1 hypothetical protein D4L85_01500 [Chryseolinea soli]